MMSLPLAQRKVLPSPTVILSFPGLVCSIINHLYHILLGIDKHSLLAYSWAMKFTDLNLLELGNTIQMTGAVFSGNGKSYLLFLPGEDSDLQTEIITPTQKEWEELTQ